MRLVFKFILIAILAAAAWFYWQGAVKQLEFVNTDLTTTDQDAYMDYARKLAESGYTFAGERNRMPIYPFLQSLFYSPGMTVDEYFSTGKYNNLVLSLILLGATGIILFYIFSWLHALVLLFIFAFTLFIFKAGFFQAELLFYFLNLCLFLLLLRLIQKPAWPLAVLAGITGGLAHLTKASILPGLVIFMGVMGVKAGWTFYRSRRQEYPHEPTRNGLHELLILLVVGLSFLVTVFPYIRSSKQIYGQYFYNVNSTFYVWYDSWEEAKQGTRAHGDRKGWPDMPPEEIPSLSRYLEEHTAAQMVQRLTNGAEKIFENVLQSYGYQRYFLIYLLVLLAGLIFRRFQYHDYPSFDACQLFFVFAWFGAYFLLYAWYTPITEGVRLILAQYMPVMFAISMGIKETFKPLVIPFFKGEVALLDLVNGLILLVLMADIHWIVSERIFKIYGGY